MHLLCGTIADAQDDRSYVLKGTVTEAPYAIEGGHVFFAIGDGKATLKCAAFEPTKGFRNIVKSADPRRRGPGLRQRERPDGKP